MAVVGPRAFFTGRFERGSADVGMDSGIGSDMFMVQNRDLLRRVCGIGFELAV